MDAIRLVIIAVLAGAFGQIYFKKGVSNIGATGVLDILKKITKVFSNFSVLFGLFLYALSSILWLFSMTKLDISLMYPLTSLGYFITAIFASKVLKENINIFRWLGIIFIGIGSIFIMLSV